MPVIVGRDTRHAEPMQWGLVPGWAKEPRIGYKTINARSETVAERPAYRYRRCLLPAGGFYEWRKSSSGKQPYFIHLPDEPQFGFAGLWESWHRPGGEELRTFTILTTTPNALMAPLHDRRPVILPREVEAARLDPAETRASNLSPLLQPYRSDAMAADRVSTAVNDPRSDAPELTVPLPLGADGAGH